MSEDAKTVGVGHYNGGEYGDYWDVLFTAPAATEQNSHRKYLIS